MIDAKTKERFFRHVDRVGECWTWTGSKLKGYGLFSLSLRCVRAHRVAWEMENGPIPAGMMVCHRCDNPACVRVEHLFLGTQAENIRDAVQKNRFTGRPAKLTGAQVAAIRQARQRGVPCRVLAEQYGVSGQSIRMKTRDGFSRAEPRAAALEALDSREEK